jgi:predicted dehydrogenase
MTGKEPDVTSDSRKLNVAVIGLGMGRAHLDAYQKYPRSAPAAICDANQSRLADVAAAYKIPRDRCFADYRKMLRSARKLGIQAVSVALPNALHAPVTIAALRAGLHVLCEKPMAMNAAQARAMIAAARKARRKLMINFSFRFNDQSRTLKRLIDSGELGEIYFARTVWHRRRGIPGFGAWFGQKKLSGGGPIIDLGVHRLDLAMWLMGNPRPISVSASVYAHIGTRLAREQDKAFDVEDLGCALVRFDNGATLILEASWAGFSEKREDMVTQLYGTKGGIIQRNLDEGYAFEARAYGERAGAIWETKLQQATVASGPAYQEFVDAVLDGREPLATGRHGLDVQLILDAIYRSAATRKEIRIRHRNT